MKNYLTFLLVVLFTSISVAQLNFTTTQVNKLLHALHDFGNNPDSSKTLLIIGKSGDTVKVNCVLVGSNGLLIGSTGDTLSYTAHQVDSLLALAGNSVQSSISSQTVGGSNGNVVYLSSTNTWSATDANAESTTAGMLGIRISSTVVLVRGIYVTSGLTAAATYYVSETTGAMTTTKPTTSGAIVRILGYALSTTVFYLDPDKTFIQVN